MRVCEVRYGPTPGGRPRALVLAALHAYWALGAGRRHPARRLRTFAEQPLLISPLGDDTFAFARDPRHEAHLVFDSDDGNALTVVLNGKQALEAPPR